MLVVIARGSFYCFYDGRDNAQHFSSPINPDNAALASCIRVTAPWHTEHGRQHQQKARREDDDRPMSMR